MVGTKKSSRVKFTIILALFFAISLWSGCGGGMAIGGSSSTATDMKIAPSSTTVRAGDSVQFSATVTGNVSQEVTWSVNGVAGGNSSVGTIDSRGKYQAPLSLPTPNSVKVQATSLAEKSLSASGSVTLQNPLPVPQSVSPTVLPVGSFSLTVIGTNFVTGSQVLFGGTALTTTCSSGMEVNSKAGNWGG